MVIFSRDFNRRKLRIKLSIRMKDDAIGLKFEENLDFVLRIHVFTLNSFIHKYMKYIEYDSQ